MKFLAFSAANRRRCEHPQGFSHAIGSWSGSDWMTALVGEVGEAANLIKKLNRSRDGVTGNTETDEVLHAKLAKELGDVFIYLDLIAQRYGLRIDECARRVFNEKSKQIGYPVELSEDGREIGPTGDIGEVTEFSDPAADAASRLLKFQRTGFHAPEQHTPLHVEKLIEVAKVAALQFRRYQKLHMAKPVSAETQEKVAANARIASRLEIALARMGVVVDYGDAPAGVLKVRMWKGHRGDHRAYKVEELLKGGWSFITWDGRDWWYSLDGAEDAAGRYASAKYAGAAVQWVDRDQKDGELMNDIDAGTQVPEGRAPLVHVEPARAIFAVEDGVIHHITLPENDKPSAAAQAEQHPTLHTGQDD